MTYPEWQALMIGTPRFGVECPACRRRLVVSTVRLFAKAPRPMTMMQILRAMRCRSCGHKGAVGKAIRNERYIQEWLRAGSNWPGG